MGEPKELKARFDEIFQLTKYADLIKAYQEFHHEKVKELEVYLEKEKAAMIRYEQLAKVRVFAVPKLSVDKRRTKNRTSSEGDGR